MKFQKFTRVILLAVLCFLTLYSQDVYAQKVKLIEGDLSVLKGVEDFNMQFEYTNMGVGKYKNEQDYVDKKRKEYDSKEAGRGEKWQKLWIGDRELRFEPKFIELFEKYSDVKASRNTNSKYTIVFKTKFTEPGYNIVIQRRSARIDGEAWVVETANPNKVIAKLQVTKAPGKTFGGYDYDTGQRIQEAYAAAGKGLGKFFKKKMK